MAFDGEKFGADVVTAVKAYLAKEVAPLKARIAALESQQNTMKYVGTWSPSVEYAAGNFCSHNGSIWHCAAPTRDRPGGSPNWTLAVKRGKDAR